MSIFSPEGFRTCPATGRSIHRQAEGLIKANAVVAVVALLWVPSLRCCWS